MFEFMFMDAYKDRKVGRWDSEDGLQMVSTCLVNDGREPFETAVRHPAYNGGDMVIVECYLAKELAQVGHDKWRKLIVSDKLPSALTDCGNSEISQMCDAVNADMVFERDANYGKND